MGGGYPWEVLLSLSDFFFLCFEVKIGQLVTCQHSRTPQNLRPLDFRLLYQK